MEEDIKLGKDIQEFEEIFGNVPIKDLEKIREYIKRDYIPKSKVREKIDKKLEYYNSYRGLEIYKKDNFKEIVITLEQLKQELLEERN